MSPALFTICEGDYHLGVGALLNSALRAGFRGSLHVFSPDPLPPWARQLSSRGPRIFDVAGCPLHFHSLERDRHPGYEKPFCALALLRQFPEIDALFYADPDITILAPWNFFEVWIGNGVALVGDANFPVVPPNHPWRSVWRSLNDPRPPTSPDGPSFYANSGFFGLARSHESLLEAWKNATLAFERSGGDTQRFSLDEAWAALRSDQDLLATALSGWDGPVSWVGPEGMGFTHHYFLLSHATEQPKPWRTRPLLQALRGWPSPRTVEFYLAHANGAIRTMSPHARRLRTLSYRLARFVGRFYRRLP